MIASDDIITLSSLYASVEASAAAAARLRRFASAPDDDLSDAIDEDAAARRLNGVAVPLVFYLSVVPELPEREVPFDTAIDVALKDLVRRGETMFAAAKQLMGDYPEHAEQILEAARLSSVFETSGLRSVLGAIGADEDFKEAGPVLADGRRRYQLGQLIGQGAYGRVFAGTDLNIGEGDEAACAIKVLDRVDAASADDLRSEARKLRSVRHPNVVRVYDCDETEDGRVFLVMERVEGRPLSSLQSDELQHLERSTFLRIAQELLAAVSACHQLGLLHADIKPANVLLDAAADPLAGRVLLTDFGLARTTTGERGDASCAPNGTPAYMAPELQGRRSPPTIASDVYSTGMALRALAGLAPLNYGGSVAVPPWVDERLRAILDRACAVESQQRMSSAVELSTTIAAWADDRAIAWLDQSWRTRGVLAVKRRPWRAAACAVGTVALLAIGGAAVAKSQHLALESARAEAESRVRQIVELNDGDLRSYNPWRDWVTTAALIDRLQSTNEFIVIDPDSGIDAQIDRIAAALDDRTHESGSLQFQIMQANLVLLHLIDRGSREDTPERLQACLVWSERTLEPGDPFIETLQLMQHCLAVKRAIDFEYDQDVPFEGLAELQAHHEYLKSWLVGQTAEFQKPITREQFSDPVFRVVCRILALTSHDSLLTDSAVLDALRDCQ